MGERKLTATALALALAGLGLSACENNDGAGNGRTANRAICTPFPAANAAVVADPAGAMDDCLHRWAYELAPSTDTAQETAQAAMAACATNLARWNQQQFAPGQPGMTGPVEPAPSLVNGQPTTPIAEHYSYAQGRALFYVVQARAGRCAPPPRNAADNTASQTR